MGATHPGDIQLGRRLSSAGELASARRDSSALVRSAMDCVCAIRSVITARASAARSIAPRSCAPLVNVSV